MRRLLPSLVLVLLLVPAASPRAAAPGQSRPADTGTIRGTLDLSAAARSVERRPSVSAPGAAVPRAPGGASRGIVYLESAPRGAFDDREPSRQVMDQRNETFVPHVLALMTGDSVDFPNSDTIYHNVFSLSKARRFDLGRYAAGRSKSVRFDRPGVVRVFCDIHAHMNAFIVVFNHPFFAVTDADGRFALPPVPAGTYTVVGWYEGAARVTREVTVPAGGVADLALVVP
ncbi:MAG: carboxypeptidase regulatory-like domain-containing protein [Vicinamibacterales bacterium]